MNSIFKNGEFKRIIYKLIILHVVFMVFILIFMGYKFISINRAVSHKTIAMTGKILYSFPELESEVVGVITKSTTPGDIDKGRVVLENYGYTEDMGLLSQPILKDLYFNVGLGLAILVLIFLSSLLILITWEYSKLFSKIARVSRASERVIHGDFSIVLPEDNDGDFALLYHQFNQMANRIKASLEHLKDDKVFLKNIISDISHQLKTPLSSLIMLNELMLSDKNMDNSTRNDFLCRSQSQLERIEWLTLNLLKMARLEAGAIEFNMESLPLAQPVAKALSALELKIKEKEQNIILSPKDEIPLFYGDRDWTAEALINIIKNCIEHTPAGGDITIQLTESPIFSRIVIKDIGEGIDSRDIPHIFKRFYKGTSSVKAESIGIGLALARTIVESQNGTISVKSEKGKGTEFTVTFLKGVI